VYRLHLPQLLSGFDFVLVARSRTSAFPFDKLCNDFLIAAKNIKVLKNE
jgi:RNase P protein component